MSSFLDQLLGLRLSPSDLGFTHMAARALIVFIFGLAMVRMGDRRLLGRHATIDVLLVVVLGSVLSRGINGQAAFFPTLFASACLVLLHHLTSKLALKWPWFSHLVKGMPRIVVQNGQVDQAALEKANMTPDDLDENLRIQGNVADAKEVKEARLERNGVISVVPKRQGADSAPRRIGPTRNREETQL